MHVDAHTLVILVGLAAVLFPVRNLWPRVRERGTFVVIDAFLIALWAIYCAWAVFDSWWFIRFLLPSVPIIMLGLGVCADALFRTGDLDPQPPVLGGALGALPVRGVGAGRDLVGHAVAGGGHRLAQGG